MQSLLATIAIVLALLIQWPIAAVRGASAPPKTFAPVYGPQFMQEFPLALLLVSDYVGQLGGLLKIHGGIPASPDPPPEEPPGTPTLRTGNPRVLFIEEGDTGIGKKPSTVRSNICAFSSLTTGFQTYMTRLDAVSTSPSGKARGKSIYEGYGFAMAALLHDGSVSCITFKQTRAQYRDAAIAHALAIAAQMYPTLTWEEHGDMESLQQFNSPSLGIAMIVDWTRAIGYSWSNTDLQTLMNGCTKNFDARTDDMPFGSRYQSPLRSICTLAMQDIAPTGTYSSVGATSHGKSYQTIADEMFAQVWTDWLDADGMEGPQATVGIEMQIDEAMATITGGEAFGDIPGTSYMMSYIIQHFIFAFVSATSCDFDLFTRNNYLGQVGYWLVNSLRPTALVNTNTVGLALKYAVAGLTVGYGTNFHPWAFHSGWAAAQLKATPDTSMIGVLRSVADTYGFGHTKPNNDSEQAAWPIYRFILGNEDITAQTPTAAGWAKAMALGNGWTIINSGYGNADDTKIVLWTPPTPVFGGHWKPPAHMGWMLMHKRASLIPMGGQSKGDGQEHVGFEAYSTLDSQVMTVYDPSEPTTDTHIDNGVYGGYSYRPQEAATGICSDEVDHYLCDAVSIVRQALNASSSTYHYLWARYHDLFRRDPNTGAALKVSYADKEFFNVMLGQDQEWMVLYERVTAVNAAFVKGWNLKLGHMPTPVSPATFTTVELGEDFDVCQGGIWTMDADGTVLKMLNTTTFDGVTGDAVLFFRALEPDSTWNIVGCDTYEFNDLAGNRYEKSRPDIASIGTGVNPTITTTQNHNLTNGKVVRLHGVVGSTPDLNKVYTATVTGNKTFTINETVSVAGSGGHISKAILTAIGQDSAGAVRLTRTPDAAAASNRFRTCLQWGDKDTLTAMTACTAVTNEANSRMEGVEVNDSVQKWSVMFSTAVNGAVPTFPIEWTSALTGSIKQYVANVTPSTTYHCKGTAAGTFKVDTSSFAGSATCTSSAAGVLEVTYTR